MIVNRLLTSFIIVPILLFLACIVRAESGTESLAPALNEGDFSVLLNDYVFTPGDTWSDESFVRAGEALSSDLAGEVVIDNQQYKYFQHTYNGFKLFSAAASGKGMHPILAEILLENASVLTARNIMVGDSLEQVQQAYGPGKEDNSDNQHWLVYQSGKKQLMFHIEQGKVSDIMLKTDPGAEQSEISPDQAISIATEAIHTWHLTTLDDKCLRYDLDESREKKFFIITVREDNRDISCGGDPEISHRLFDIKVARDNTQILTNADNVDGDYRDLNSPATNNE
ncbi:hypothetical protein HFD91_03775 [Enterobacteriaceae bacterium EKM102V]|uniref:hypothetical protein n=1 Tax=Pantoea TaxID=53335 RepID=UPI00142E8612|nr:MULTISPECIES: hypothetical protein [Pantoea]KAF6662694.1 hypothetical protein HFD91_03775 [Enterobacteriaceae bacterium EKM102V]KAF6671160.1 hypothetical protein HFD97_03780 [Pantoea sp. EKM103V]